MTLGHIAVFVSDIERTRAFYETYFGGTANEMYHNPKTGLKMYYITFGGVQPQSTRLEIMSRPDVSSASGGRQIGYTHINFGVDTKDEVDNLTARLERDGYVVLSRPRTTGDGFYESCVADPDGNEVEIAAV